jgi:lysophospholipase L1-like esterase
MVFTRSGALALSLIALTALAGCSSSGKPAAPKTPANYYVSIGDSYAAGFQPTAAGVGSTNRNGFAYQLTTDATAKGYHFTLANFACAGATTDSVLTADGCTAANLGPGATDYSPSTQAAAAETFLRAHQGHVGLITVSIGGNDITACGKDANPTTCVITALTTVKKNLTTLVSGLRAAAGASVPIVGITYPDVLLADYLSANTATKGLAPLSVVAFKSLINPALQGVYTAAGAKFVDVTAATGAYGSMSTMTNLSGVGSVPVPVAKICQLTFMCQFADIHPRTAGYALIAHLILATLPAH